MPEGSNSTVSQIVVGVIVAIVGSLFGGFLTWITLRNEPPVAELVPNDLKAEAFAPINFSAAGSNDPDGDILSYEWSLNALPFGSNPAARCAETPDAAVANCQFVMPGTHAITVTVADGSGARRSKSAAVTVSVPNGYVSLFVRASSEPTEQAAAERALLYAVDWGEVQTMVGRPLLIYDPDLGVAVYGSSVERDVERARQALAGDGARDNFKIAGRGLRPETKDLISIQASEAGISIFFFDLAAGEVLTGVEQGIGDGGFLLTDSPDAFSRLQRSEE